MRLRYPLATLATVLLSLLIAYGAPGYAAWAILAGLWIACLTAIVGILEQDISAGAADAFTHDAKGLDGVDRVPAASATILPGTPA